MSVKSARAQKTQGRSTVFASSPTTSLSKCLGSRCFSFLGSFILLSRRFYIGCESCSDWFHGRCVGILQAEAGAIDDYICPKCDPHSKQNYPNLKKLNRADHELIRKTFKAIRQNRNSQHFLEPVDQAVNPKYYEIVKEPMGKSTI
jgi:hypothetical protein